MTQLVELEEMVVRRNRMMAERDIAALKSSVAHLQAVLEDKTAEANYYRRIAEETGRRAMTQLVELEEMVVERNRMMAERDVLIVTERALSSELEAANRTLSDLVNTDVLTGVLSRRALFERLDEEHTRSRRFGRHLSVLMVDIDHFKRVNDVHGHQTGDLVLKAVAGAFFATLRMNDLIGRYGGEEFVAILPESGAADAFAVAERLRAAIAELSVQTPDGLVSVTTSIGVAQLEGDERVDSLLARADSALYAAKGAGRNRTVIS
jgi:diguanylate cyclase (GGDEF)-like protein